MSEKSENHPPTTPLRAGGAGYKVIVWWWLEPKWPPNSKHFVFFYVITY